MIGTIENAILDHLRAAGEEGILGYKFTTLESYPDNWQAYVAKDLILKRPPAAWVTFAGGQVLGTTNSYTQISAKFGLIVASKNYRNQKAARHGEGLGEVGSYQLAQDAIKLLVGQNLDLEIGAFELASWDFVSPDAMLEKTGFSMFALQFQTEITLQHLNLNDAEELSPFELFAGDWDLPPIDTPTDTTFHQQIGLEQ